MKQQSTTRRTSPQPAHGASDPAPAAFGPQQAQLAALSATLNSATPVQRASNRTGLPDPLKAGVEALSGLSMDHVRVHYNSARPAQLNAHAYAQGHEIHVATGQERHLPHEAWHVVQQAQGRVRATAQAKGDVALNDDQRLEREADTMGALAASGEAHSGLNRPGSAHAAVSLVSQLRRIAPALTAGATEVANGQSPSTDRVAPGPANVWDYTVTVTAPQADRAAALAAIRDEYRQMGHGFGNSFLAIASIGKLVTANAVVAGLVYDTLLPHGVLPVAAAPLTTNAAKKGVLVDNPAILTLPANLDFLLGLAGIATLVDPVRAVIRASYGNPAHTISSTVEYSEGLKGYISKVQDTGPQVSASLQDRPNYAGEYPIPGHHMYRGSSIPVQDVVNGAITAGFGLVPRLVTFSNVHHTGGQEDMGTQIARIDQGAVSRLHHEAGLDAITKVIAEGGRFAPVAALGMALRNDSMFFTALPVPQGGFAQGAPTHRGVVLTSLWKRWTKPFGGQYGITAQEIAQRLKVNPLPNWAVALQAAPQANGHNYDLDAPGIH